MQMVIPRSAPSLMIWNASSGGWLVNDNLVHQKELGHRGMSKAFLIA